MHTYIPICITAPAQGAGEARRRLAGWRQGLRPRRRDIFSVDLKSSPHVLRGIRPIPKCGGNTRRGTKDEVYKYIIVYYIIAYDQELLHYSRLREAGTPAIMEKPYFCGAELIYRNDEMGPQSRNFALSVG